MNSEQDACEYCGNLGELENKLVTAYFHRKGQHFIFEQVPARVCRNCGQRYYSWDVVEEMERLMDAPETQAHTRPVPVISLSAK